MRTHSSWVSCGCMCVVHNVLFHWNDTRRFIYNIPTPRDYIFFALMKHFCGEKEKFERNEMMRDVCTRNEFR